MAGRLSHGRARWSSLRSHVWLTLGVIAVNASAAAQPARFSLRATTAAALMVSASQVGPLRFDRPSALSALRAAYALYPWLEVGPALHGGWFFASKRANGGLLALSVGPTLRVARRTSPYLGIDFGAGVTGASVRPFVALQAGLDVAVGSQVSLGPALGYGQLVQWNRPGLSTDARYIWLGFALRVQLAQEKPAHVAKVPIEARRPARPPATPPTPLPDATPDVLELIERALPAPPRVELLAPVLFAFDSDALEPLGVAMLHEVAHTLRTRPELRRVEIQGYADERGDARYNHQLSRRRAARARAWLIEHGVAPERLILAAHGASGFVESGDSEAGHQQNRRVIFRVLEVAEP